MFIKIRKKLAAVLLVLCYACGQTVIPIYADSSMENTLLDELLAEREKLSENEPAVPEVKKTSIDDFNDVKTADWFYPYLEYLVTRGMINGKTPSSFEPQSTFSYAECSAVIVRYLGLGDEADKRMKQIVKRDASMQNIWYAGYFEVMAELGLFVDYGLFECKNNKLVSVETEMANMPVARYRFAESISKSFELESTLKARNVYPEIGGSGREFIAGGGYNENVLDRYEGLINDFAEIPSESRRNVLKAYYNGIFNGDITCNFYPHNNLTRAEMAKVLATVCDYSLRTRLIEDGYAEALSEEFIHTDAFGVKTLRFSSATTVLLRETENLSIIGGKVEFVSSNNAPFGYAIDTYLYENGKLSAQCTLHDYNDGGFTYKTDNAKVLMILRNVSENARVEGSIEVEIVDGEFLETKPKIRTM